MLLPVGGGYRGAAAGPVPGPEGRASSTMTSSAAASWPGQIAKLPEKFEMEVVPNPLGSTGKHATQVSSDGKGVSAATKNPAQAWTVLSRLFTSRQHGIERFANGLGSPGQPQRRLGQRRVPRRRRRSSRTSRSTWCCRPRRRCRLAPPGQRPLRRARADPAQRVHQGHPRPARRREVRAGREQADPGDPGQAASLDVGAGFRVIGPSGPSPSSIRLRKPSTTNPRLASTTEG